MSKRILFIIGLTLLVLALAACGTPPNAPVPTSTSPSVPPPSATPQSAPPMSVAEAKQIASQSTCLQSGTLKDTAEYNPTSNTWWIDMTADKPNCNPACVVDVKTKTAEVNWRCTGVVVPDNTPQSGGLKVIGRYTGQLPAADAIGRVLVLDLSPDNTAKLTTQFIGKGAPAVDSGKWAQPGKNIVVTIDTPASGKASDKLTLTFQYDNNALVLQGLGSEALTLKRVPSGNTHATEFGGVKIVFDAELAKSAQGENLKAIPVSEGPVLGGAAPAAIRFLFDDAKAGDYFDPRLPQVLVYKADEWAQLDPSFGQSIAALKTLLAAKPATIAGSIPVFPPIPAAQVFHAKPHYLDFQNGSGVGFVTYYAQAPSPVVANQLFYSFQGLTNDGQYYVAIFEPVNTALLPADQDAALGGKSYEEWAKNYATYLTDLTAQLSGLLSAAYTPDLVLIDELVKSIEITTH